MNVSTASRSPLAAHTGQFVYKPDSHAAVKEMCPFLVGDRWQGWVGITGHSRVKQKSTCWACCMGSCACKARSWHSCEDRGISGSRSVLRSTVGRSAGRRTLPFLTVLSDPWVFKRYVSICGYIAVDCFCICLKKSYSFWAWWHTPVILACRRQEDCSSRPAWAI